MNPDRYNDVIIEALNTWQFFRKTGYPADAIYFHLAPEPDGSTSILITLRMEGLRDFSLLVGSTTDPDAANEQWLEAAAAYNAAPLELRARLYETSTVAKDAVAILWEMHQRGFPLRPDGGPSTPLVN